MKEVRQLDRQVDAVLATIRARRQEHAFWQQESLGHAEDSTASRRPDRQPYLDPRDAKQDAMPGGDGLYVSLLLMVDNRRVNTVDFTRAQTERGIAYLEYLRVQRALQDVEQGVDPRAVDINRPTETHDGILETPAVWNQIKRVRSQPAVHRPLYAQDVVADARNDGETSTTRTVVAQPLQGAGEASEIGAGDDGRPSKDLSSALPGGGSAA